MIVIACLSFFAGVLLGLLGGGGSILMVPILIYVARLPAKDAMAMSLLVVGVTSLAAVAQHARQGRVRWQAGLLFGSAAMVGAFGGGRFAQVVPDVLLLLLFAGLMITVSML